jgi:DNA-binding transcriptional ArsR family regulator
MRTYDTTIEDVWDALTNAERIPRWFLPISGDLRLSGSYQLQGNAGGEITRCEPPRLFAVTWVMNGPVSWLTVSLASDPAGGTFGPGAMGTGWDLALMGLGRHLATGIAVDRSAALAWSASEEGREFIRQSQQRMVQGFDQSWYKRGRSQSGSGADHRLLWWRAQGLRRWPMHAFDVLGDPVRRRILELLAGGEHTSGDIVAVVQREFGITQSAVSQQLRVLRDSGFTSVRADGARRIYSVDAGRLREVDDWLDKFRALWGPRLDALATEIARGKRKRRQQD